MKIIEDNHIILVIRRFDKEECCLETLSCASNIENDKGAEINKETMLEILSYIGYKVEDTLCEEIVQVVHNSDEKFWKRFGEKIKKVAYCYERISDFDTIKWLESYAEILARPEVKKELK